MCLAASNFCYSSCSNNIGNFGDGGNCHVAASSAASNSKPSPAALFFCDSINIADARGNMNNAIATSHNKLGENIHELVAKDLSSSQEYVIVLVFSDEEDPTGLGTDQCTEVMMQVRIASSKDRAEGCLTGSLTEITRDLPTDIRMLPNTGLSSSTNTL